LETDENEGKSFRGGVSGTDLEVGKGESGDSRFLAVGGKAG
jgi:hypothetical protein